MALNRILWITLYIQKYDHPNTYLLCLLSKLWEVLLFYSSEAFRQLFVVTCCFKCSSFNAIAHLVTWYAFNSCISYHWNALKNMFWVEGKKAYAYSFILKWGIFLSIKKIPLLWGSKSRLQDQELHALQTDPARHP